MKKKITIEELQEIMANATLEVIEESKKSKDIPNLSKQDEEEYNVFRAFDDMKDLLLLSAFKAAVMKQIK